MDTRSRVPVRRKKVTSGDQPTRHSKPPGNSRAPIAATSPRRSVIGSSNQISGTGTQTPIRSSTRPVRPTAKKVAMTELENDSSDSNLTPPASITPKSTKKRKALKTPKVEIETPTPTSKKLIVSLGTLEISDSDDVLSGSPRKRQKVDRKVIDSQNVINLCSEDDSEANGDVIVLSGDEADCIPNPPSVVCNTDPEVSRSAGTDEEVKPRNITPKSDSDPQDLSLTQDVLNSLYKESLKQAPPAFSGSGHPPAFFLRSSVAVHDVPSHHVAYTEEPVTPGLLTTRFFARAISAICDVSQSNNSGATLPDPCVSQPPSGIPIPAAIDLAGIPEEITNTVVESTQDRESPKVIKLEDDNHASPPISVEQPESTLQETAGRVSPECEADLSEQLFDESDTCGDVEMQLDEPVESFFISSDIDVLMSAPDPGEAEISSIVVEEPARKDSLDTPSMDNSSTDAPSQSQKIHIHLLDPSIFKSPEAHILLNCLKDVIVDQDKLTSFNLGYPDFSYTEEMPCK